LERFEERAAEAATSTTSARVQRAVAIWPPLVEGDVQKRFNA